MFSKDWGSKKLLLLFMSMSMLVGTVAFSYQAAKFIHREFSLKHYSFSFLKSSETLQNGWKTREIAWDVAEPFQLIEYKVQFKKSAPRKLAAVAKKVALPEPVIAEKNDTESENYSASFFDVRLTLAQQFESLSALSVNPKNLLPAKIHPVRQPLPLEVKPVLLSKTEPVRAPQSSPAAPVIVQKSDYSVQLAAKNQGNRKLSAKIEYSPSKFDIKDSEDLITEEDHLPTVVEDIRETPSVMVASAHAPPLIENEIKVETSPAPTGMGPFLKEAPRVVIRIEPKKNPVVTAVNTQVSNQPKNTGGYSPGAQSAGQSGGNTDKSDTDQTNTNQNSGRQNGIGQFANTLIPNTCSNYQVLCLSEGLSLVHWEMPLTDINFKTLSYEGETKTSQWMWGTTQKKESWTTLSLERKSLDSPVPVLPYTSVLALTQHRKQNVQNDTGIIFGKIQPGYTVQLGKAEESRADPVLYVHEESRQYERTFVFMNVTQGPQMLYLYDARGTNLGAVIAPTLRDTATYLDLRTVRNETLSGMLLNSGKALSGVSGASVRVLGQWNQKSHTDSHGGFTFNKVNRFGVYPLYLDSECGSGYTHRYKATSDQNGQRNLYCFTEKMIQSWMTQFQGGVDQDSGVLIGAVPSVAQNYEEGELFPELKSLALRGSTTPEIYTLTPEGHAKIHTPLDKELPRFLGIQLPYGALVSEVVDRSQRVVWSEMVFTSPRVLHVVGPY